MEHNNNSDDYINTEEFNDRLLNVKKNIANNNTKHFLNKLKIITNTNKKLNNNLIINLDDTSTPEKDTNEEETEKEHSNLSADDDLNYGRKFSLKLNPVLNNHFIIVY